MFLRRSFDIMNKGLYKNLRRKYKLNQKYVADLLGITRQTLSKYEVQDEYMPITVFLKLNVFYNVDEVQIEDILRYKSDSC